MIVYGDIWLRGHATGGYALIPIGPETPMAQRVRTVWRDSAAVEDADSGTSAVRAAAAGESPADCS